MARKPRTRLEAFIALLLEHPDDGRPHRLRAYVLEQATVLELRLDEVLAASIASGIDTAEVLRSDVLWRMPVPVRVEMLEDLLDRRGLRDRWPFVVPVLRAFFDLRHQLAHGWVMLSAPADGGMNLMTFKRGRTVSNAYRAERLEWLAWQAHVTALELSQIWAAVVPPRKSWHEPGT
jgi:hypothetical protein